MADILMWQTMDSAPRDGTQIITTRIYSCGTEIIEKAHFDVVWGKFVVYWPELYDYVDIEPLFWFPIPEKPQLVEHENG